MRREMLRLTSWLDGELARLGAETVATGGLHDVGCWAEYACDGGHCVWL